MAKQKSGLGRGLNALFSEVEPTTSAQQQTQHTEPVQQKKEETQQTVNSPSDAAPSLVAPQTSKETPQESAIYFSEDALENAKVVERAARSVSTSVLHQTSATVKNTSKTASTQKKPSTAPSRAADTVSKATSVNKTTASPSDSKKQAQETGKPVKGGIVEIQLDKIKPNPDQPRTNFKPEEIEELANSIKKEGLLQPILVRKVGDHYQIIAGERRYQACLSLHMKAIPVRLWMADNDKALELALIENIQRTDLNPIEEAYGYKRLMERKGMTQSEIAQAVSKGRSTIANALRLLDLPEEAQQLLFEEKISAGHARAILSIPTAEGRKTLTNKLMEEKVSVRETEAIARLLAGREKSKEEGASKRVPAPASFKKAARGLSRVLSAPVRVKTVQGKNKIEIQFQDEEELERIFNAIVHAE